MSAFLCSLVLKEVNCPLLKGCSLCCAKADLFGDSAAVIQALNVMQHLGHTLDLGMTELSQVSHLPQPWHMPFWM